MNRQEAIKVLKEDRYLYESDIVSAGDGSPEGDLLLAIDMAVAALEKQEVRHGKWVFEVERGSCLDYNVTAKCSECGWEWIGKDGECVGNNRYVFGAFVNGDKSAAERFVLDNAKERKLYDYCPCCGACMENEE